MGGNFMIKENQEILIRHLIHFDIWDYEKASFSGTMILSIWPLVWWQNGAKLVGQPSKFASFPSGKITRFLIKMMKFYEVFKNVIEVMEKDRGMAL